MYARKCECVNVCVISRLVCFIVSFYGITTLVPTGPQLTDVYHTHNINRDNAREVNIMLTGTVVMVNNCKEAVV